MSHNKKNTFLITIDVEDWFQVENFKSYIPFSSWDSHDLRVERNTHRLLDLFDESGEGSKKRGAGGGEAAKSGSWEETNVEHRTKKTNEPNEPIKPTNQSNQQTNKSKNEAQNVGVRSQESGEGSRIQGVKDSSETNQTSASEISDRNKRSGFNWAKPTNQSNQSTNKPAPLVQATFFILGWIAERLPNLVRDIHDRGHEVASHGFGHELCSNQSPADLKADLIKSKHLIEDIIGAEVAGYRAPSFSVNNDILKIIEDAGYRYDSSYNSFDKHGRYGKLSTNGFQKTGIAYQVSDTFHELPVSNLTIQNSKLRINNYLLPWGGGGYFRLIPDIVFNKGVRSILEKENGYLFYMHPWEIDPSQPRVSQASAFFKFRHYVNLHKTGDKLKKMINRFRYCRFSTCGEYLGEVRGAGSGEQGAWSGER